MDKLKKDLLNALSGFDERMVERKAKEDKEATVKAENDRQAYMKRTGRTEMKP